MFEPGIRSYIDVWKTKGDKLQSRGWRTEGNTMLKEYHPIEVVVGTDGSCAIEGVPEGHAGARKALNFLFGHEPAESTYATNPLWDWLYFPVGTITEEQRSQLLGIGRIHEAGGWVYKFHEVPHVEQPGAYTESFFEILKEPWIGRLVAAIVTVVLFSTAAYFWLATREAGYLLAGFSDVITSAETPHSEPKFVDRLALQFSDGDHLAIPVQLNQILHRGPAAVVFAGSSGTAYLVGSDRIGESVVSILQLPGATLNFDTRGGPDHILLERADGSWGKASVHVLRIGKTKPAVSDRGIRSNDESTFVAGTTYSFEGGIEANNGQVMLYRLPRKSPPYKVELTVEDPGLLALFEYVATRSYAVTVIGTLTALPANGEVSSDRSIGQAGPDLVLSFARRFFVPAD